MSNGKTIGLAAGGNITVAHDGPDDDKRISITCVDSSGRIASCILTDREMESFVREGAEVFAHYFPALPVLKTVQRTADGTIEVAVDEDAHSSSAASESGSSAA
jgi:hypothetical protein